MAFCLPGRLGGRKTRAPFRSSSQPSLHVEGGLDEVRPNESNAFGLEILYPNSETSLTNTGGGYDVDFIAVHGLGGHRRKTWTNAKGEIWLQQWLPEAIPGARVYTFGYDAKPYLSNSKLGIHDFARSLLGAVSHIQVSCLFCKLLTC